VYILGMICWQHVIPIWPAAANTIVLSPKLEELKFELTGTKDEVSGAMGSLSSFLTAMKDDADEDDDQPLSDLDTLIIQVGAKMEEMRTTIADIRSDKDDLARELNITRSENEDAATDLASRYEMTTLNCR
jgi:hypothetical protein